MSKQLSYSATASVLAMALLALAIMLGEVDNSRADHGPTVGLLTAFID